MTSNLRFTMDADPTVKVGDRVHVRNLADGFLSGDMGQTMSWLVKAIVNGRASLAGKQHRYQIGQGWSTDVNSCVVDMGARESDAFNGWRR
jgi:hypothetical protein